MRAGWIDTLGLLAVGAPPRRAPQAQTPRDPLLLPPLHAAATHLLGGRPTRALLAWSVTAPLTPYPEVESELMRCDATLALHAEAPAGSLGEACSLFRSINGLRPMSAACATPADPAQKLAVRRLLLNDVLHVLLDFEADWPGQLGVFSFVAAQRYCPQFEQAARWLGRAYMTAAPWLRADLGAAEARGRQLALAAPRLLTMPLEQEWRSSLSAFQVKSNLKPAKSLGVIDWTPALPRPHSAQPLNDAQASAIPAGSAPPQRSPR